VIDANQGGNGDYSPAAQVQITIIVNQASVNITASSPSVIYGAAVPTITPSFGPFQNGDNSSVLTTQPTCVTAYTVTSNAGSSPSTSCSGAVAANYTFTYTNGSVTVGQASVNITASSPAVTYGAAVPTITPSFGPFQNGQNSSVLTVQPICTTAYLPTSNVGSSPSTSCSGAAAVNYSFTYTNGSVTIGQAPLTVTANNATMAVGAALPTFTASYSGFVNGQNASVLSGSPSLTTPATSSSPAGTYPIWAALGSLTAQNYSFSTFVNGTLSIVQAPAAAITTSAVLGGSAADGYFANITITNSGAGAATNVTLTTATLGATTGTPLPQGPVSIAAGGSTTFTVSFSGSAGTDGAGVAEKYSGTYTGGSFSASVRSVTLP